MRRLLGFSVVAGVVVFGGFVASFVFCLVFSFIGSCVFMVRVISSRVEVGGELFMVVCRYFSGC